MPVAVLNFNTDRELTQLISMAYFEYVQIHEQLSKTTSYHAIVSNKYKRQTSRLNDSYDSVVDCIEAQVGEYGQDYQNPLLCSANRHRICRLIESG
jgi:hypothetical protein